MRRAGRLRAAVGPVLGRVRTVPRGRLTAGAAAVALAVSVPFGGLRQSYAETHPAVDGRVDQLLHADPFTITVTGASVVDALRSYRSDGTSTPIVSPDDERNHLVVLKATVVNTSEASVGSSLLSVKPLVHDGAPQDRSVLYAAGLGDGVSSVGVLSVDDATDIQRLSPGVPYHLAIVVEVSGATPTSLDLGVARLSHDPEAISEDVLSWQHPEPAYQLTVPVVDKRGAKQRPAGWTPAEGDDG